MQIMSSVAHSSHRAAEESTWRIRLYDVARLCAGTVLLVASVLRVYAWKVQLWHSAGVEGSRAVDISISLGEAVLAAMLICGFRKAVVRWMALASFAAFLVFVALKLLRREADCNCFGDAQVPPVFTFGFDAALLTALFVGIPSAEARSVGAKTSSRAALAWRALFFLLLIISPILPLLGPVRVPAHLANDGTIGGPSRQVLLEPQSWLGHRWPLLPHVGEHERLSRGAWLVVLYRDDCDACQKTLTRLNNEYATAASTVRSVATSSVAKDAAVPSSQPGLAIVEVPDGSSADHSATIHSVPASVSLKSRLETDYQWILPTPSLIWLQDGIVVRVESAPTHPAASESVPRNIVAATVIDPHDPFRDGQIVFDLGFVPTHRRTTVMLSIPAMASIPTAIRAVRPDCACMSVPFPPAELAAGRATMMELTFDAPEEARPYVKRIVMVLANPRMPVVNLVVRAGVGLPLTVDPSRWSVQAIENPASESTLEATVANAGDKPYRILYGMSELPDCVVTIAQKPIAGGATNKLLIRLGPVGKAKLLSTQRATVHLHTDCQSQPELDIAVEPFRHE